MTLKRGFHGKNHDDEWLNRRRRPANLSGRCSPTGTGRFCHCIRLLDLVCCCGRTCAHRVVAGQLRVWSFAGDAHGRKCAACDSGWPDGPTHRCSNGHACLFGRVGDLHGDPVGGYQLSRIPCCGWGARPCWRFLLRRTSVCNQPLPGPETRVDTGCVWKRYHRNWAQLLPGSAYS